MTDKQTEGLDILKPEELFRPIDDIVATAKPLEPLWGFYLYKKAITSIIADPGAGKTTFGYALGMNLCLGKPYLGIHQEEPVNALYMDLESSDALVKSRKILVQEEEGVPNFIIYNHVDYYFPQIADVTLKYCLSHNINLVIIDNQTVAFQTRDENDNSEASRQMKLLRMWTNDANVALVLVHHTNKAGSTGTRAGTGAYARARLADILITLTYPDPDVKDLVCFEVTKNRMTDDNTCWYLKKIEGRFEFTNPPMIAGGKQQTNTVIYATQKKIFDIMEFGKDYKFDTIVKLIIENSNGNKPDIPTISRALKKLQQQGRMDSPYRGYWKRK